MNNEERFRRTLEEISCMNFNTGRADLLGKQIREKIRSTFCPNKPCPNCNGLGEVPNTPEQCDSCRSYYEYPMGPGGSCGPWGEGKKVQRYDKCLKFKFLVATLPCLDCRGKVFKKE